MTSLEQQLQASVDLLRFTKPTVTEEQLHACHSQLARVIRERVKVYRAYG